MPSAPIKFKYSLPYESVKPHAPPLWEQKLPSHQICPHLRYVWIGCGRVLEINVKTERLGRNKSRDRRNFFRRRGCSCCNRQRKVQNKRHSDWRQSRSAWLERQLWLKERGCHYSWIPERFVVSENKTVPDSKWNNLGVRTPTEKWQQQVNHGIKGIWFKDDYKKFWGLSWICARSTILLYQTCRQGNLDKPVPYKFMQEDLISRDSKFLSARSTEFAPSQRGWNGHCLNKVGLGYSIRITRW